MVKNEVLLTDHIRQQINNDVALRDYCRYWRQKPPYYTPVWHFVGAKGVRRVVG